jgi:trans-aconitate methyltransferase
LASSPYYLANPYLTSIDNLLDLGCGSGELTSSLSPLCSSITAIDSSPSMISACPSLPNTTFLISSALSLPSNLGQFSKIFSSAALHWILRTTPEARAQFFSSIYSLLAPGGSFVSEAGAHGNIAEIHTAVIAVLTHRGVPIEKARDSCPWWFGSEGEYRGLLDAAGFKVEVMETELRQTRLTEDAEGGIRGWVRLFAADMLTCLGEGEREEAAREVEEILESVTARETGGRWVNYVRIRFVARREG